MAAGILESPADCCRIIARSVARAPSLNPGCSRITKVGGIHLTGVGLWGSKTGHGVAGLRVWLRRRPPGCQYRGLVTVRMLCLIFVRLTGWMARLVVRPAVARPPRPPPPPRPAQARRLVLAGPAPLLSPPP